MSDTSRREFIGIAAALGIGAPGVTLAAVRGSVGKSVVETPASAIVETSAGKVRGFVRNGIVTFKGIPYGASTAGEARFQPPAPPTPWTDVRATMSYGPVCPQPVRSGWQSDRAAFLYDWDDGFPGEDCLRLNVWTPAAAERGKRPVMVWLHGGGYEAGSSQELPSYDGENLSRRGDVVVVSINHRLNVFGYLNMAAVGGEKYAHSINVGMLDIVAALQWVRDNVARFGGDPANVTVFGQSGGGGKVSTLMAMPSAQGLFHKAIVQSGSLLRLASAEASAAQAAEVLKELEAQGVGREQLTQLPAARLVEIATVAKNRLVSTRPRAPTHERLGWQPWVDGTVVASHPFDPRAPALATKVPMLIGTTLHEFSPASMMPDPRGLTEEWLTAEVAKNYGDAAGKIVAAFKSGHPGALPFELAAVISATTIFRLSAVRQAQLQSANAPAYLYWFAWKTPVLDGIPLAYHCVDLAFAFDNIDRCANSTGGTPEARDLAARISQAWIQFARTGNPNHAGLPRWPAVSAQTLPTMIFDTHCEVKNDPDAAERKSLST
ncbi:MAG TPA: carboxylesterase/lipase family protein [Steroidobacteraceae bacterium]|nr:carboxylesterase/lipase family protein [Steroidobacteraceae bacterium]